MGEPNCSCVRDWLLLLRYRDPNKWLFRQGCDYTQAFIQGNWGSERTRSSPKVTHTASSQAWVGMQVCLAPKLKGFHYFMMRSLYIRNLLCRSEMSCCPLCASDSSGVGFPKMLHLLSGRARSWQNFADSQIRALHFSSTLGAPLGMHSLGS